MKKITAIIFLTFLAFSLNAQDIEPKFIETPKTEKTQIFLGEYSYIKPVVIEEITLRIIIAPSDKDNDGVIDKNDKCPNTLAGIIVNEIGCELDDDADGVVNSKDRCPNTKEGIIVDNHGCELDSDADGVVDSKDRCPNTKEGIIVDNHGCELDSDADGVVDSKDRCPNTRKDFAVDIYGCATIATLEINFASNKYDIKKDFINYLENFAIFLNGSKGYDLIIYGHTDSMGEEIKNQVLSINRANAVKQALVDSGVNIDRISTVGKGESEPIASNMLKKGRAQNRRIEIELIK